MRKFWKHLSEIISGKRTERPLFPFFRNFRGILSRAESEFAKKEEDSDSETVKEAKTARIGLYGLDA